MVARTLVEAGRPIPIRAVNLSDNGVTLQKGLQIGRYYPVLRVVRCEEEGKGKETSVEEFSSKVRNTSRTSRLRKPGPLFEQKAMPLLPQTNLQ
jgi:hypothetical protein